MRGYSWFLVLLYCVLSVGDRQDLSSFFPVNSNSIIFDIIEWIILIKVLCLHTATDADIRMLEEYDSTPKTLKTWLMWNSRTVLHWLPVCLCYYLSTGLKCRYFLIFLFIFKMMCIWTELQSSLRAEGILTPEPSLQPKKYRFLSIMLISLHLHFNKVPCNFFL